MADALWLQDALVDGGAKPRPPVPGWERRGKPGLNARGVVVHHIGIGGNDLEPGLRMVTYGRPGLENALANLHLARDGRPRVIAARVAWHAGKGGYRGLSGNSSVLGIEAENTTGQYMTDAQVEGYVVTVAALCRGLGINESMVCAHHEWRSEKPDPWGLLHGIGMGAFRSRVRYAIGKPPAPERKRVPDMVMFWHTNFVSVTDGFSKLPYGLDPDQIDAYKAAGVPLVGEPGKEHPFWRRPDRFA